MRQTILKARAIQAICLIISAVLVPVSPLVAFADNGQGYKEGESSQCGSAEPSGSTSEQSEQTASEGSSEDVSTQASDVQDTGSESNVNAASEAASASPAQQEPSDTPAIADTSCAQGYLDELSGHLESLGSLTQSWSDLYRQYKLERDELERLQDEHAGITAKIQRHAEEAERAQSVIDAAYDELALVEGEGFAAYVLKLIQPAETESTIYLLHELIDDRGKVVLSANSAISGLERAQEDVSEKMRDQGQKRLESRRELNAASCEVEAECSRARRSVRDALASLPEPGDDLQLEEDVVRMQGEVQLTAAAIAEYEAPLAGYYDELDSFSGANGAISFGEGADFSMSEYVFVEKWGKAIDSFFDAYAKEAGEVPLRSYGRQMASAAYHYRVDPRLCAAVSVVESSGGKQCIKPYNAWGWGAKDSDPYGGAASWSSFDEAIEQWHKGMAGSKSGLATARTVSSLALVYCSDPIWGADVAEAMGKISALAT